MLVVSRGRELDGSKTLYMWVKSKFKLAGEHSRGTNTKQITYTEDEEEEHREL